MTDFRAKIPAFLLVVQLCLLLAGCDSLSAYVVPASSIGKDDDYASRALRLHPGDKVKINVYGEERLTGDYEVDSDGTIVLPLIGSVEVTGMTKKDLERTLTARLRTGQILLNPVVSADIAGRMPFYVLGEVEKPGEYAYRSGLNVLSAVAVAGGYTYRASKSRVLVKRARDKTITEYQLAPDIPIYPGDLVNVPERIF
jgi:protein involved in polysaccharide export with SLBB domain